MIKFRRNHQIIDKKIYLECKNCQKLKKLEDFYRLGGTYSSDCKECYNQKAWDKQKKKKDIKTQYEIQRKKTYTKNLWFNRGYFHTKTYQEVKKRWGYPKVCPICGKNKYRMEIHHTSYKSFKDRKNYIICCKKCHQKIHSWKDKNGIYFQS